MFSDRRAPLHALIRPLLRDVEHAAPTRRTPGGNRESPGVQRDERELETVTLFPQKVFLRDEDVLESDEHIADAAQSHELAAMCDFDARRVHLEDERGD